MPWSFFPVYFRLTLLCALCGSIIDIEDGHCRQVPAGLRAARPPSWSGAPADPHSMAASLCLRRGPPALRPLLPARAPLSAPCRGRKSRTDPPAKSKAARLKEPPPVHPEELLVVKERYQRWRGLLGALRAEFKEEVLRKQYEERVGSVADKRLKQETEEHRMLMAWNDAENARLRKLREERYIREEEEEKQRKLQASINREATRQEFLKERELEILHLQEEAKHFITPENLDQRIEESLDNPKSYNFAVDKEGRVAKRTVLP